MNVLQRALVEKTGNDNGFEHPVQAVSEAVELGSARHKARVAITAVPTGGFRVRVSGGSALLDGELARSFPDLPRVGDFFCVDTIGSLAPLLRRAAALAQALPRQAVTDYEAKVQKAFAGLSPDLIEHTEVQSMVRQRVGQQAFREAMLDYWGNACAVTGIALPAVLRASHAKPWAECESDAERLDVFNGFLLCANLDALFDRFLISFGCEGALMVSKAIVDADRKRLGLLEPLRLRWIASEHAQYLAYHRGRFDGGESSDASQIGG
jgi:putative restriction endonuclease